MASAGKQQDGLTRRGLLRWLLWSAVGFPCLVRGGGSPSEAARPRRRRQFPGVPGAPRQATERRNLEQRLAGIWIGHC